jgi:hypothetical protein
LADVDRWETRLHAEALYATGASVSGDPFGAESLGRALARRVAELADDPSTPLFFGRLDLGRSALRALSAVTFPSVVSSATSRWSMPLRAI